MLAIQYILSRRKNSNSFRSVSCRKTLEHVYFVPTRARSVAVSAPVRLSVCVSSRITRKLRVQTSLDFLYTAIIGLAVVEWKTKITLDLFSLTFRNIFLALLRGGGGSPQSLQ